MKISKIAIVIFVYVILYSGYISADQPELISRNVLLANPSFTRPSISPDGKMLAYLAPKDGVLNVWIRNFNAKDDTPITSDKKRGISKYFWSGDSKSILYLQDRGGNEEWHLYKADIAPGSPEAVELTPYKNVRISEMFVSDKSPGFVIVSMNKDNPESNDLYSINLKNSEAKPLVKTPGMVLNWIIGKDLKVLGCIEVAGGGMEYRLSAWNPDDGSWRVLKKWGPDDSLDVYSTNSAGDIWYIGHTIGKNFTNLYELNIKTLEEKNLFQPEKADIDSVFFFRSDDKPKAVSTYYLRKTWSILDASLKDDFEQISKTMDGDVSIIGTSSDDNIWLLNYTSDISPNKYFLYDRKTKQSSFLFSERPELDEYKFSTIKPVVIKARDGLDIPCYLTIPAGSTGKKMPMVLLVHGGPWSRNRWKFSEDDQLLCNRGYILLQVNFRGSTGFGKDFINAGDREWGRKMQYDLLDAVRWAVDYGYADPERIAIMGGSYGGYATLIGITDTPGLFACAIDVCGPSNLYTLVKSFPKYHKSLLEQVKGRVGDWDKNPDIFNGISPIFKVDKIRTPLLIVQGKNDPRVKVEESTRIVEAIRKNGGDVIYLEFPDEGHGIKNPKSNIALCSEMEKFLHDHLGGRYEPATEEEKAVIEKVKVMDAVGKK